jgi:CheY-like chemotaxis protein
MKLLYVEDDIDVRETIVTSLNDVTQNILTADDGIQALKILSEQSDIDAILSDINMPNLNGLEMLIEIRRRGLETPVVFLSGIVDRANLLKALRVGALDFLEKPIDIPVLCRTVKRALQIGIKLKQLDSQFGVKNVNSETDKYAKARKEIEMMKYESATLIEESKKK